MTTEIRLPTFHPRQAEIYRNRAPFNAVRCGRGFGKTTMVVAIAANAAAKGKKAAVFTPEHKQWKESFLQIRRILLPLEARSSVMDGTIRTSTSGICDFWHLTDNELAGRGREYDVILIDEAAWTKDGQMKDVWEKSVEPTMRVCPNPSVWAFSTPKGISADNFFYHICRDTKTEFREHHAGSLSNPMVRPEFIEERRKKVSPLVFQQEYLADFVNWSGVAFFSEDKLLVEAVEGKEIDGKYYQPVDYPSGCDSVFLVIDTGVKGGSDHDGTAVTWWATSSFGPHPLICLDWDLIQIDAALLEQVLPQWIERGKELARQCRARFGCTGAYIEDAQSGSVLLQQCALRGIPAEALPSKLTSAGKDGRALNASGPVFRGEVKFSRVAYDKNDVSFKDVTRNHLVSQVVGFRLGDKDAARRSDDLLDTFTYAVAVACGGSDGWA